MKISIITAVYNRELVIAQAIKTVQSQTYKNLEHIIVDGNSKDNTLSIIKSTVTDSTIIVSEPDKGIYDALNKGLKLVTGDIVGFMHSDDFYADNQVLSDIAHTFTDPSVMAVYGDLDYVSQQDTSKIIRRWRSGDFSLTKLRWGWMPPHPTLYVRRSIIEKHGLFDLSFKIAADYDSVLRYLSDESYKVVYIPRILVKMRVGGESNKSIKKIIIKTKEDYRALRKSNIHTVRMAILAIIWKNVSKLSQFF